MIDREIRELTVRFEAERSTLENEIRKGKDMIMNRDREIDNLKGQLQGAHVKIMEGREA